jgi:hypothetical protein
MCWWVWRKLPMLWIGLFSCIHGSFWCIPDYVCHHFCYFGVRLLSASCNDGNPANLAEPLPHSHEARPHQGLYKRHLILVVIYQIFCDLVVGVHVHLTCHCSVSHLVHVTRLFQFIVEVLGANLHLTCICSRDVSGDKSNDHTWALKEWSHLEQMQNGKGKVTLSKVCQDLTLFGLRAGVYSGRLAWQLCPTYSSCRACKPSPFSQPIVKSFVQFISGSS